VAFLSDVALEKVEEVAYDLSRDLIFKGRRRMVDKLRQLEASHLLGSTSSRSQARPTPSSRAQELERRLLLMPPQDWP
jgi:hypothetical protein